MRCTLLTIFLLLPQSCASQAPIQKSNVKENKQNEGYYLLQSIDSDFLSPPMATIGIDISTPQTVLLSLAFYEIFLSESEVFISLLNQINVDLKKHNMDSVLKEHFSNIVRESDLTIKKELALDSYNKKLAKIGDKVIQLNTSYIFDKDMKYIEVLVRLKIAQVKRFTNLGRNNQLPRYDVIYKNQFKFISAILSESGGSKAIVEEKKRKLNNLYKLELSKIELLKSSMFKAQKKSRLNYSYHRKMKALPWLTSKTLKKEALTRLWLANNSANVRSTLKKASLELSRMLEIDLASYKEVRTHRFYEQLPPFAKKLGIIEQTEKRAIVINYSYRYCSIPLSADYKYCF